MAQYAGPSYTSPAGTKPMTGDTLASPGNPKFEEQHIHAVRMAMKPSRRSSSVLVKAPSDITGTLTVAAATAPPTPCGTLTCVNGKAPLVWSLINGATDKFSINSSTGVVTKTFSGAMANPQYIGVQVVDCRGRRYYETTKITVT